MRSIRAIFRRGQREPQQPQQQQTPEELSRASSASSLNAEQQKQTKGAFAKVRKGVSKEKIDKIGDARHKRGVVTNNNKEGEEGAASTKESLLQELQEMMEEKSRLALQLGERNGQLSVLRNEISKLKVCARGEE